MKIIDELIDDLSSDNKELSDILIRTKVLAHKLKNQTLVIKGLITTQSQ